MIGESDIYDLVAAYVLHAVTPEEAELVRRHLPTCASCQALQRELRQVVERLPALAGEMEPPTGLTSRLMAIVSAEAATAGSPLPGADRAASGQAPAVAAGVADQVVGRPHLPRATPAPNRAIRRLSPLLAMAAVLALILVGLGLWRLSRENETRPTVAYAVQGTAAAPRITGSLAYYEHGTRLDLTLRGLRPLPSDRVYELWLIRGSTVVKGVGSFRPDAAGNGHYSTTGEHVPSYTLAGVTIEKAPLATRPTLPIVAIGKIGS